MSSTEIKRRNIMLTVLLHPPASSTGVKFGLSATAFNSVGSMTTSPGVSEGGDASGESGGELVVCLCFHRSRGSVILTVLSHTRASLTGIKFG